MSEQERRPDFSVVKFHDNREGTMLEYEYEISNGCRVLLGLTETETAEFELLDAQIPFGAKPVWPDTANSPTEARWLELFTKHELAKQSPRRRFGRRINGETRAIG
jgi:hypothetical protein